MVSPCLNQANISLALATNPSSAATAEHVIPACHPERDLRRNLATAPAPEASKEEPVKGRTCCVLDTGKDWRL